MASSGWQMPEPEPGPAPGLSFGGFGARLIAYIVDAIVITVVMIILIVVAGAIAASGGGFGGFFLSVIVIFIVSIAYFPYCWWRYAATPGMMMLRLKVVRDSDGGPISGGQAVLRLIGYWVSGFVFYLGYIWIFVDKRRRGWHDLIAGTVVVQQN